MKAWAYQWYHGEIEINMKPDWQKWARLHARAARAPQGTPGGFQVYITDKDEREELAMFIKRLVRKCYTLGHRSKLTADAMEYLNTIYAQCSPMRKLIHDIMDAKPTTLKPKRRASGREKQ